MKREVRNKTKPAQPVQPRIEGDTAERIRRLANQTGISENRIANMMATAGATAIEEKLKP